MSVKLIGYRKIRIFAVLKYLYRVAQQLVPEGVLLRLSEGFKVISERFSKKAVWFKFDVEKFWVNFEKKEVVFSAGSFRINVYGLSELELGDRILSAKLEDIFNMEPPDVAKRLVPVLKQGLREVFRDMLHDVDKRIAGERFVVSRTFKPNIIHYLGFFDDYHKVWERVFKYLIKVKGGILRDYIETRYRVSLLYSVHGIWRSVVIRLRFDWDQLFSEISGLIGQVMG